MLEMYARGVRFAFVVDPKNIHKDIAPGMVATIADNGTVKTCTDKDLPAGFFLTEYFDEFPKHKKCIFWTDRVVLSIGPNRFETDEHEPGKYHINDLLYCSPNGKVTNDKRYKGNYIIGIVCSVKKNKIGFIHILTRYIEEKI